MSRRAWIQFGFLAAFWGASYLFIKVALEDVFEPPMVVFIRTALAALVLIPFALKSGALPSLRGSVGVVAFLALLQVAAPFMLISFGQEHISSSLAGILVATAPIFTFLLAIWISQEERVRGIGLAGVGLGILGVVLLLGIDAGGGTAALVGGLMVVLASLGYALGAYYLKRNLSGIEPTAIVAATMAASALMAAPVAAFFLPTAGPSLEAVGSLTALGVLGTGISFVLFYDLIHTVGPAKASLVAYIAPGFAVIYGVILLDESFTAATAAGLLLIVSGSWLAAEGRLPWQPRVSAADRELAAGGVDVAPAGEAHGGGHPRAHEPAVECVDRLPA
jgi:drug/metabolite transporter (DMT)-like permease